MQKITIKGSLPGYNEYINKCRHNRYAGAKFKADTEDAIMWQIKTSQPIQTPCKLKITFFEPNNRRDYDNIVSSQKFLWDSMVKLGILPNDNRKNITKIEYEVFTDKQNPRIEVTVLE